MLLDVAIETGAKTRAEVAPTRNTDATERAGTVIHRDGSNLWTMWLNDPFGRARHLGIRRDPGGLMIIPSAGGLLVPDIHVPRLRLLLAEAFNSDRQLARYNEWANSVT